MYQNDRKYTSVLYNKSTKICTRIFCNLVMRIKYLHRTNIRFIFVYECNTASYIDGLVQNYSYSIR